MLSVKRSAMCSTRGGSQEMYITFAYTMRIRQNHSGFETQRRHHQKSKTGVPVAPKIGHVNVSDKKNLKKVSEQEGNWNVDAVPRTARLQGTTHLLNTLDPSMKVLPTKP